MTDYWVNDAEGKPFFVVSKAVNSGLLATLREDIVPRLLEEVPKQPTQEELTANQYSFRFSFVFDREGYSPAFFKEMWNAITDIKWIHFDDLNGPAAKLHIFGYKSINPPIYGPMRGKHREMLYISIAFFLSVRKDRLKIEAKLLILNDFYLPDSYNYKVATLQL